MSAVPIAKLGRMLNPAPGRKIIAVLQASLDASWDQPIGITVVAGYVAPLDEWANVESKWLPALAEWNIPYFHVRELQKWLTAERAKLCELYFVNIIKTSKLRAIGSGLVDMDWDAPDWRHMTTERLPSRYKQALDMSLDALGDYANMFFAGEPIGVVFDADGSQNYIESAFKRKQSKYGSFNQFAVSSIKIPSSWPLQCADLGACCLRRSWNSIVQYPDLDDRPWGEMPKGAGTRSRLSFWSLRQGSAIARAWKKRSQD